MSQDSHVLDKDGTPLCGVNSSHFDSPPSCGRCRASLKTIANKLKHPPSRPSRPAYSQDVVTEALARYQAGERPSSVAQDLQVSAGAILNWAEKEGIRKPEQKKKFSASEKSEAVAMFLRGASTQEVALHFACSTGSVNQWLVSAGIRRGRGNYTRSGKTPRGP